jgi:hypothetical protein
LKAIDRSAGLSSRRNSFTGSDFEIPFCASFWNYCFRTSNGRPIAILAAITESNLEESLTAFRQARAIEAVARLQRRSVEQGTDRVTMDEIDAEIKAVRKKRAR